jgi:hypothetical protein
LAFVIASNFLNGSRFSSDGVPIALPHDILDPQKQRATIAPEG